MKVTWYEPDKMLLKHLGGLYINLGSATLHATATGPRVNGFATIRDHARCYNVLRVDFETEDEVPDLSGLMQTMLHAAELKHNDWRMKHGLAV